MNSHQKRIADYAEQLQNQIYILQSERGHLFATSLGMSVNKAIALIQLELAQLVNY